MSKAIRTGSAPVVAKFAGQAASKQLVADLIANSNTATRAGLVGIGGAGLSAFNAVASLARKFKKKTTYYSLEFSINNNSNHSIIIEQFIGDKVNAVTDVPPVVASGQSASIQTFDSRNRDNKYTLIGRIGSAIDEDTVVSFRFKMTFLNYNQEYSTQQNYSGHLGLDQFQLFWGHTTDEAEPIADLKVDREPHSPGGNQYVEEVTYISCKYPDRPELSFGFSTPLVGYYGSEVYLSFFSIK